ncbi:unnamed protein product [Arabis nemorensis]|uniref:Endonuclease/exonuclease/phosphatase domain-containing protein n=1 Tax=Arabis nemorensis TaxID=586526 RepID=A0A565BDZ5_9BRAS|nr:unnamed protein product [Arabis nemorensis]
MITQCDMKDLKHKGNIFSWSGQRITTHTGRRIRETIQSCLDKAMANSSWSALFPASETLFLKPIASDHQPVILTIEVKTSIPRGQFRFENRLLQDSRVAEVIKEGWNMPSGANLVDNNITNNKD